MSGLVIIGSCIREDDFTIVGVWKGYYETNEVTVRFDQDLHCTILISADTANRVETINGRYKIEFGKRPIPLSITQIRELNHPLHSIVKVINRDSIHIAGFSPKWRLRPITFAKGDILYLKRQEIKQ